MGRGQSNAPSAHGFGAIMVGDECGVIKVRMDMRVNSRLDEMTPGFGIPNPPMSAFIGQLLLASGEVHIFHGYLPEAVSICSYSFVMNSV